MPENTAVESFRLVTLGTPRLDIVDARDGSTRSAGPGKGLAIITYLALAPGRSTTRDNLCDILWGDRELNSSRPQLRQTLWLIRTQMHSSLISTSKDCVSLSDKVACDAEEFLAAVREKNLAAAFDLYMGDFFSNFASPGSGGFEEWASLERMRMRRLFVSCGESLMRSAMNSGRFDHALQIAQRVRLAEPQGQTGWRLVLEARMASGDLLGTRADADQFEEWLEREEWDAEPASRAAIQEVRRPAEAPTPDDGSTDIVAELVGRGSEFAAIHHAWTEAATKARFVHVSAISGMGKTRLLRDFMSRLRAERGRARYVRANHGERDIPFSFAAGIVTSLASAPGAGGIAPESARVLIALNPSLSSTFQASTSEVDRLDSRRVGLSLLELIRSIAEEDRLALCLDDLQWADSDSRDALAMLWSRLDKENVLILSAGRPQSRALELAPGCLELKLALLDIDEVAQLVASLARLPDEPWANDFVVRLHLGTEGNPLHILEMLRFCLDANLITREAHDWRCSDPERINAALDLTAVADRRHDSLSARERKALLLLSVAGLPLPATLISSAMELPGMHVVEVLASLEEKGFVTQEAAGWTLAHDSVAETMIAASPADAVRQADRMLGRAMYRHEGSVWKKRSIQNLAIAEEIDEVAAAASPFVRQRPRAVSAEEAVRSLLGTAASRANTREVMKRLPLIVRRPELRKQIAVAAGSVAVVLSISAAFLLRERVPEPETHLSIASGQNSSQARVTTIGLNLATWDPRDPMLSRYESGRHHGQYFSQGHVLGRPGHLSRVEYKTFPDSGAGEMVLVTPGSPPVRLTFARGEDRPAAFSPDGRYLLFLTTRWTRNGWSDVAVFDLTTGATRKLSRIHARHSSAIWSPDGSRIAFAHDGGGGGRGFVCITGFDGTGYRCLHAPSSSKISGPVGWSDPHRLLVKLESRSERWWSLLNANHGGFSRLSFDGNDQLWLDPTGRWVLRFRNEQHGAVTSIVPFGQPEAARRVSLDSSFAGQLFFSTPSPTSYIESVSIEPLPTHLPLRVPYQLRAVGWTPLKRRAVPPLVRWRSLTPEIAEVDSLGVLSTLAPGTAVVEASLGGWRRATASIHVRPTESRILLDERWDNSPWSRWRRYGVPSSEVLTDQNSSVFSINGDGNYFSGAYFNSGFDARDGLAFDIEISTPVTQTQWQLIQAGLAQFGNPEALGRWDHRTGYISPFLNGGYGCYFTFPHGEGPTATENISWLPALRAAMNDSGYRLHDGKWYRVRIQIFPDGRCGLSINGHALSISGAATAGRTAAVPIIEGSSVGNKMLVRRATVRSSVPDDVDWTKLAWNGSEWLRVPRE